MQTTIFPNCSYLIFVGVPPSQADVFETVCSSYRIHTKYLENGEELEQSLKYMYRTVGIIICAEMLNNDMVKGMWATAQKRNLPARVLTPSPSKSLPKDILFLKYSVESSQEDLTTGIGSFIKELVPPGLDRIFRNAIEKIIPTFFSEVKTFEQLPFPTGTFSRQVIYSITAGNVIGHCVTLASASALSSSAGNDPNIDATAQLKEAINQCIGVFNQSLVKLGLDPKVGLPTTFDLSHIPEVHSIIYFPSVFFADPEKRLCISVGLTDLSGGKPLDMSTVELGDDSGEVEFL